MRRIIIALALILVFLPAVIAEGTMEHETSNAELAIYGSLLMAAGLFIYFTPIPNLFSAGLVIWGIANFLEILARYIAPIVSGWFA